ncbi:N-acetyl-alpha-D-glucosaminyl L-malate synthase BshA [Candidatus Woesearchaeota archaeon]|jgi:L-malate glycosyltransferase|nr:N-acetyl-alpha-D-glucosaminyl L-malate synthase BshA [Candidatus Woesearchaeota archaeon]MBT4111312.1 N-acetyl-alpha-D-glucosaminyl L-malate synthase BshA [Candidatus Woesearchaeota archaeon]MBT4335777.1 N-acetyl-alpha-D-glucosaminyl L-malate synthase BshA [Candidatus Woesearchaeota archaeon]MBT4469245.1 N-acetyl-alpha-D-glucosaminyl L-malate synthase BshA [Candidatus Woesearchaeota archaeon]MBT6744410.1 N-acetyl-alpha-D-glucosaminyl L-malate synthase BshA [Candidatus Woesearchaeota archaeon
MKSSLDLAYLLYCRPHLGGSGVMSLELAKQMRRKGHNVTLISYPGTFLSSEEQEMGINLVQTQAINYPCFKSEPFSETFASVIANLGEEKNLNIIHANYAITHGLAATTAKRILERKGKDLKVLVTSHGSDIHTNGHHHLLAPTIEQILWESDAISFVSESLQTEAEELFPSIKNKGEAIYNFVDTDRFRFSEDERRSIRSAEKIPDGATVIYHASNFRELKNAQDLISIAINDKEEEDARFYFLMVGDGPEKTIMEDKVRSLGLEKYFHFVGKKENVVPYINASDIVVLPSKRESFGLVLLEGMACGRPVIGSRVGGIPEVIQDGENGFLFSKIDELYVFADQIRRNTDLGKRFGEQGKLMASSKFSVDKVVGQYESIYYKMVAGN